MNTHEGPLLRDLISTADHPVGNIPPAVTLRDLVGTGVDLTYRVPTDLPPTYRIGEYDEAMLDEFFESDEGKALMEWFRIRECIDYHVDRNLEYVVQHPEVYAGHDHPVTQSMLDVLTEWVQS